jgi:hypothetical protein
MKLKITLTIYTGLGPSVFIQASLEKKFFLVISKIVLLNHSNFIYFSLGWFGLVWYG